MYIRAQAPANLSASDFATCRFGTTSAAVVVVVAGGLMGGPKHSAAVSPHHPRLMSTERAQRVDDPQAKGIHIHSGENPESIEEAPDGSR